MRYRIVIEIDADADVRRHTVNALARNMSEVAVTKFSNLVFLSTEQVLATEEKQVLRSKGT